jgi:hypothetical protein
MALRQELADKVETTDQVGTEILRLAKNILGSVQQLSMLSINARIEAARAGDTGRRLSVIAREINGLVAANSGWAQEIASRLDDQINDWTIPDRPLCAPERPNEWREVTKIYLTGKKVAPHSCFLEWGQAEYDEYKKSRHKEKIYGHFMENVCTRSSSRRNRW